MAVLELILLGTGTCVPNAQRNASGYVVSDGQTLLAVDMGHGVMGQMLRAKVDYREIDGILITHYHPDHVTDLVPFLFATRHTPGFTRSKPLKILGGTGLNNYLDHMSALYGEWIRDPDFPLEVREMAADSARIGQLAIASAPVHHSEGAVAYRISNNRENSITYSGDTGFCAEIITLAQNTDLLLIECSFPDSDRFGLHLTPTEVGEIANQTGCKTVVLTHQYPLFAGVNPAEEVAKIFPGQVVAGEDLQVFRIS